MATVNGGTSIKFKATETQTAKWQIARISPFGGLQKDMNFMKVARGNKSRKVNTTYPSRLIPCSGRITGSSIADLKTQVDAFQLLMEGVGNLDIDIDQQGNYRRWIAEPQQIDFEPGDSLLSVNFSFDFFCADPWGRDTSSTTLLSGTVLTSSGVSTGVTVGGTANDQLLVITLTLGSFSGASSNTITITNPATGQAITVTRTYAASDVLVLDLLNRTIKVNGTDVLYGGPLANMSWQPGAGNIQVTDDFSSRSITLGASNLNLYK